MKKSIILSGFILALVFAAAAEISAQSFLDNEYYRKAQSLQDQSEQAMEAGDYDLAASLAEEAKVNLAKSDEYVETMILYYSAVGWHDRARDRLAYARSIKADVNYKEAYDSAAEYITRSRTLLDADSYADSIQASKDAISALENIGVVEAPETPSLPETYTVRLILPLRDCLWKIAGYPFVYNDPWKWKTLYEANKSILPNPDNPNLVVPGLVLTIPSIKGETREGEYDPEATYEPLP